MLHRRVEGICAAFEVLETEQSGEGVSALLDLASAQSGSSRQVTAQKGETLLGVIEAVECQFISYFLGDVQELDAPTEETVLREWVTSRLQTLADITNQCPAPVSLTGEEIVQVLLTAQELGL